MRNLLGDRREELSRWDTLRNERRDPPERRLLVAYYVASEALATAAKHSQASRIDISLEQRDQSLLLSVRDDGVGGADTARGSGLVGLMDRVEALGGSIRVDSRPGTRTQITAELPLEIE